MAKEYEVEFKARAVRLVRDHWDDFGKACAGSSRAEVDAGARPPRAR